MQFPDTEKALGLLVKLKKMLTFNLQIVKYVKHEKCLIFDNNHLCRLPASKNVIFASISLNKNTVLCPINTFIIKNITFKYVN